MVKSRSRLAANRPTPANTGSRRVGDYSNEASITGNEGTGTQTSNKVLVNVPAEPSFTIEKLQEIAGSKAGFTSRN